MIQLGQCAGCQHDTFVLRGETAYSLTLDASGELLDRSASDAFDGGIECASCGTICEDVHLLPKDLVSSLEDELFGAS